MNALVFMALHMGNPGVTNLGLLQVFLIGVLFSLIVYYWDSLWTVIWAHTAWNFSQSIVFGLPNSGIVSKYSVFKLEAASARDGIFYNTSFGVEGSMGAREDGSLGGSRDKRCRKEPLLGSSSTDPDRGGTYRSGRVRRKMDERSCGSNKSVYGESGH